MNTERGGSATHDEASDVVSEAALDQEAIARLAYSYWEARGRQNDSPDEDWFRAEAALHSTNLAAAATD